MISRYGLNVEQQMLFARVVNDLVGHGIELDEIINGLNEFHDCKISKKDLVGMYKECTGGSLSQEMTRRNGVTLDYIARKMEEIKNDPKTRFRETQALRGNKGKHEERKSGEVKREKIRYVDVYRL